LYFILILRKTLLTIGAQEAVLAKTSKTISSANVEHLAFSLGVSIVASINLTVTSESGLRDLSVDGIVFTGDAGNAGLEHVKGWVTRGSIFSKSFITSSIGIKGTTCGVAVYWGLLAARTSSAAGTTTTSAATVGTTVAETICGHTKGKG
jgi:hypothetical protein